MTIPREQIEALIPGVGFWIDPDDYDKMFTFAEEVARREAARQRELVCAECGRAITCENNDPECRNCEEFYPYSVTRAQYEYEHGEEQ